MQSEYKYFAFISYQRKDEKRAEWLQRKLQNYHFPTALNGHGNLPKTIEPIFRDVTNITPGVLEKKINAALDSSKWLIVVCSPYSAQSPWVGKEAQYFIEHGREEYIIPFIIDGVPHSKDKDTECFPEAILSLKGKRELLAANIHERGRDAAVVKVIAQMFNLSFDELWQWTSIEQRKQRRILFSLIMAFVALVIFLTTFGYSNRKGRIISQENNQIHIASQLTMRGEPLQALYLLDSLKKTQKIYNKDSYELAQREALISYNQNGSDLPIPGLKIIRDCTFSENGKVFAVSGLNYDLLPETIIFDIDGKKIKERERVQIVGDLSLSSRGKYMLTASDSTIVLTTLSNTTESRELTIPDGWSKKTIRLGFSPDETRLFHSHEEGSVCYNIVLDTADYLNDITEFIFCTDSTVVMSNKRISSFVYLNNIFETPLVDVEYLGYNHDWGYAIFQDNETLDLVTVDTDDLVNESHKCYVLKELEDYLTGPSDSLVAFIGMNHEGSRAFFRNTRDNGDIYIGYIRTGLAPHSPYRYSRLLKNINDIQFMSPGLLALVSSFSKDTLSLGRTDTLDEIQTVALDTPYNKVLWFPYSYQFAVVYDTYIKLFDAELLQTTNIGPSMNLLGQMADGKSFYSRNEHYDYYLRKGHRYNDILEPEEYFINSFTESPFFFIGSRSHDMRISRVDYADNLLVHMIDKYSSSLVITDMTVPEDSTIVLKKNAKALAFSSDGTRLYYVTDDDSLSFLSTGKHQLSKSKVPKWHEDYQLIVTDNYVMQYDYNHSYKVYDPELLYQRKIDLDNYYVIPDSEIISIEKNVVIFHDPEYSKLFLINLDKDNCISFDCYEWISPDRRYMLDENYQLWDFSTGQIILSFDTDTFKDPILMNPEQSLWGFVEDDKLRIYDIKKRSLIYEENVELYPAFSLNDNGILSLRKEDGSYLLKDIFENDLIGSIPPTGKLLDFNFASSGGSVSPNKKYFARFVSSAKENVYLLCVWDIPTKRLLMEKEYHLEDGYELEALFSTDGRFLNILKDGYFSYNYPLLWGDYDDLQKEMDLVLN